MPMIKLRKPLFTRSTTEWVLFLLITIAAVLLRMLWMLKVPNAPVYDFQTYHEIAVNIATGYGHTFLGEPIAFQGMGYPTALGLFYKLTGETSVLWGKAFNLLLSTATLLLTYPIFRKLTNSWKLSIAAYALIAFLPNYIAYVSVIGAEVFLAFLFAAVVYLQLASFNKWVRWPLLGIFIGLAALTKPVFLVYPVVAAAVHYLREKNLKSTLAFVLTTALLMMVTVAPWTYRNYQKYDSFIPVSYNSGYVLYLNNNANNVNGGWMPLKDAAASPELRAQIDEILEHGQRSEKLAYELDPLLKAEGKRWILSHPLDFAKLGMLRVQTTFFNGAWDIGSWAMNGLYPGVPQWTVELERDLKAFRAVSDAILNSMNGLAFAFVLLAAFPVLRSLFRREEKLPVGMILPTVNVSFFILVYFVFEGQARYNFPVLFLLAVCAVLALHSIWRGVSSWRCQN
ncbi:dolichyl-phosphate-mannose-protein mannosyltransferase [Tumebacillus sp. BK434]|uniref:glycosyltransferase family 39 protein n=1 Tax=Tumebacillus sp. BK434 TaxID=2512169 RepID=UPI00104ED9CD|nr:glycosyltransferase family 39 protein [Tumebacillus sp. BK434]TCP57794.1 dolichyl-phosphate-mannose-protein mannosyltransferase [Tumebacillus sp. BK434]